MVKKLMIRASAFAAALMICVSCFFMTAGAYLSSFYLVEDYYLSDNVYFYDESGRFSDDEKAQIKEMLEDTADKIGFNVGLFASGVSRSDATVEAIAIDGARKIFDKDGTGTVFLFIDLDGKTNAYDVMASYHDAYLYYTDSGFGDRSKAILKKMQTYFPKGGSKIVTSSIINGTGQLHYREGRQNSAVNIPALQILVFRTCGRCSSSPYSRRYNKLCS